MNELREKAISELYYELTNVRKKKTIKAYERACDFAYAYQHLDLISFDECDKWITTFAEARAGYKKHDTI